MNIREPKKYCKYGMFIVASAFFLFLMVRPCCRLMAEMHSDFIMAAEKAGKSVVFIIIGADSEGVCSSYGTGTIISSSGYIVTNYHVVRNETRFSAQLPDGSHCQFEKLPNGLFYAADSATDIAVMKLASGRTFIPIESAPSSELRSGEWVLAIGNPYGLSSTITSGIVSSLHRSDVGFADIEDFIQSDVPINPGNSGGPLVNLEGKMVGMNTAIRTMTGGYQGISFSIPSELVVEVSNELIRYGHVRRAWIGLLVRERKESRNIVVIDTVLNGSPAEKAGLKKGDIIREANGEIVTGKRKLIRIIRSMPLNSTLALVIERNKSLSAVSVRLTEKSTGR